MKTSWYQITKRLAYKNSRGRILQFPPIWRNFFVSVKKKNHNEMHSSCEKIFRPNFFFWVDRVSLSFQQTAWSDDKFRRENIITQNGQWPSAKKERTELARLGMRSRVLLIRPRRWSPWHSYISSHVDILPCWRFHVRDSTLCNDPVVIGKVLSPSLVSNCQVLSTERRFVWKSARLEASCRRSKLVSIVAALFRITYLSRQIECAN